MGRKPRDPNSAIVLYGITEERLEQIKKTAGRELPEDEVFEIVNRWTAKGVNRGYAKFRYGDTSITEIRRIEEVGAFSSDDKAALQAVMDGYCAVIPVWELPPEFPDKRYGLVDTKSNRKAIDSYCNRLRMESGILPDGKKRRMPPSLGIPKKRFEQILDSCGNISDSRIRELVKEWTPEAIIRGYDIFEYGFTGMMEINKIDDVNAFENDYDAAVKAAKDGFCKIIPVNELPGNFDMIRFGWIDTPSNRYAIHKYCEKKAHFA